jgi:hypothetical protein
VVVCHICLASDRGALIEGVVGIWLMTKEGAANVWQGFPCMLFVVISGGDADLVV